MTLLKKNLNVYDLYRPVYDSTLRLKDSIREGEVTINGEKRTYKRGFTHEEYTPWLKEKDFKSILLGEFMADYVNRPDVREAMHIPDTVKSWE